MATGPNVQLFSFASMFCARRSAFSQNADTKRCHRDLAALLWDRKVSCAVSGFRITVTDWVAIVPGLNGDGRPRFVLAEHINQHAALQPYRSLVEAVLYNREVPALGPIPLPSPRQQVA